MVAPNHPLHTHADPVHDDDDDDNGNDDGDCDDGDYDDADDEDEEKAELTTQLLQCKIHPPLRPLRPLRPRHKDPDHFLFLLYFSNVVKWISPEGDGNDKNYYGDDNDDDYERNEGIVVMPGEGCLVNR